MSRYYRTPMGDDHTPVAHESAPPSPARTHAGRSRATTAGTPSVPAAQPAPTRAAPSPAKHHGKSKLARHSRTASSQPAAPKSSHHHLLVIGGACLGLGALVLLLTGDRRRSR